MTALEDLFAIRRILVALDCATECLAALDTAADLALRVDAELEGLFVEDINLVRLAELPFEQELSLATGLIQHLDVATVEREFRAASEEARHGLEERAARSNLRWTFRVVRGVIETEIGAAEAEADLLVLGRGKRPLTRHVRLATAAERLAQLSTRPVLLLQGPPAPIRCVAAAVESTPESERTLAAAVRIHAALERADALAEGAPLQVLCVGATAKAAKEAERQASGVLARANVPARIRVVTDSGTAQIADMVRGSKGPLLVIPARSSLVGEDASELLNAVDCPVLFVR
ncbi:MAG: universal stress protein [Alphaproteobacteria bacterium]